MIDSITRKAFLRYGWIIEFPLKGAHPTHKNLFRVVKSETNPVGWRIAYLVIRDKKINKLEQHIDTFESFEPVRGRSLFFVADKKESGAIRCFYLDKPVILKKGIWHGIITLGQEAEIKITENARVKSIYWKLGLLLGATRRISSGKDK